MFDPTKGNKKITDQVEERSDEFAALFGDLSPRQQLAVIDKMNQMISDDSSVQALLSQTSQQPAQLGSGQGSSQLPTPQPQDIDEQMALNALIGSANIGNGVKATLRRMLNPRDPNPIMVESDGTPSDVKAIERERDAQLKRADDAEKAQKDAEQKLKDEQDESSSNSLAGKLKKAKQDLANARDGYVEKSDMVASYEDILSDVENKLHGKIGGKVIGRLELVNKIKKGIEKLR